jgi:hypothetical protein
MKTSYNMRFAAMLAETQIMFLSLEDTLHKAII